ncbi:ABC transporter substrate-binding protein [Paenibacillus sp. WLX1005]|uniref:ABC transporter substrate-binding protein n=1 Tax=Paenibacillus sp. WLX1005 TaxID=3243766 RepID=UPI00398405AC
MFKKTWMSGILALSLAGVGLAGCGTTIDGPGGSTSNSSDSSDGKPKLVISTWGFSEDFLQQSVFEPFEKEHNVDIVLETGNNAERLNKIRQGSSNVDLIYLSDYYAQQGIDEGLFDTIDRSKIPNIDNIYDIAKAPNGDQYGPAYTVAQLGIAYNPDMVSGEVKSWSDLWKPEFKGNLTMPAITATAGPMMVDAASRAAGNEQFSEDAAFTQLTKLNDSVVKYYSQTSEYVNMIGQGEIAGGPIMEMYFKDIQAAVPNAKFVSPEDGGYAVINTVNIVKGSANKELAEQFIDWQLGKDVQEASAKAKVDSPVNTQVVLTDEEAQGLTYGADVIESLRKLDMKFVNDNMPTWTDRWNREIGG